MRSKSLEMVVYLLVLACSSCGGSSTPQYGTPGGGSGGGSSGAGAGVAGGGAGTSSFMAVDPCSNVSDYVASPTSIATTAALKYSPQCLKVTKGTMVTIEASATHPLSGLSTGSPNNPIPSGGKTASQTVTFPAAGFFPYECTVHFSVGMKGVVWVQ